MRYDWILFDADHTLFDFDRSSQEALLETLQCHGITDHPEHWNVYDRINKECWADFEQGKIDRESMRTLRFSRFFQHFGSSAIDIEGFADRYLTSLPTRPYFMEGAAELLSELHGHVHMGVITNGLREVQRPRLERAGIDVLFQVIVVSGEINHTKPQHAFFDHAHHLMGRPEKKRVLVVGDSLSADIVGGIEFGFKTCWFNPGVHDNKTGALPDYEISALHQIPLLIGLKNS